MRLDLADGDSCHVLFGADSQVKPNDELAFQLKNPVATGLCPATSPPTTSTSTSSSTPTSSSTSTSTSTTLCPDSR